MRRRVQQGRRAVGEDCVPNVPLFSNSFHDKVAPFSAPE
jgi:hypothetical protein